MALCPPQNLLRMKKFEYMFIDIFNKALLSLKTIPFLTKCDINNFVRFGTAP
jgi:hypothetical protein